jgi:transcriptional regulator with GAF, ATPase, and Fis domain
VLERAVILSPDGDLEPDSFLLRSRREGAPTPDRPRVDLRPLEEVEREHVARVVHHTAGKIYGDDGAAALLGLKPSTLQSRMKKLGVDRRRAARGEYGHAPRP